MFLNDFFEEGSSPWIIAFVLPLGALALSFLNRSKPGRDQEPISGTDGWCLFDNSENPFIINTMMIVDRLELKLIRDLLGERALKDPRMQMKVAYDGVSPDDIDPRGMKPSFWERDAKFHIDRHVVDSGLAPKDDATEVTEAQLKEWLKSEVTMPLPRDRPLFQYQLVQKYEGGASAVLFRVHHVMGDGIAFVKLFLDLMDPPTEEQAAIDSKRPSVGHKGSSLFRSAYQAMCVPFLLVKQILWSSDSSSLHGPTLSGVRHVAWSTGIPLPEVKAVKNALGVTVNDLLMSCLTGALGRLFRARNETPPELRVSVPVNMRGKNKKIVLENSFTVVFAQLPTYIDAPLPRLREVKRRMDELKTSAAPFANFLTIKLVAFFPTLLWRALVQLVGSKATAVLTNVPAPARPLYFGGKELRDVFFWVPALGGTGVGLSILSYADSVRIGVTTDAALCDDPQLITDGFVKEFYRLQEAVADGHSLTST